MHLWPVLGGAFFPRSWFLFPLLCWLVVGNLPVRAEEGFPYENATGTEAALLLTAGGAFGFGYYLDQDHRPLIPEEIDALDPATLAAWDRPATRYWSPAADRASDYLVHTQMALPLGLSLVGRGADQPGKVTLMYLETMALNGGLTYLLKNWFQRTRPFVYNDNPDIPLDLKMSRTARRSFPSGHTSNAFASMVFFASVYSELNPGASDTDLVWTGCLASAAVTGILRIRAGRHFSSDVVAGAVLGSLVGYLVPSIHELDQGDAEGTGGQKVYLSYGFRF